MTIQSPFPFDLHHFILFYFLKLLLLKIQLAMHLIHLQMLYEFTLIFLNFMPQNLLFKIVLLMQAKLLLVIIKVIFIVIVIFFLLPYVYLIFHVLTILKNDQILFFITISLSLVLTTAAHLIFIQSSNLQIFLLFFNFKNLKLSFLIYLQDLNFGILINFFLFIIIYLFQKQKFQGLDRLFPVLLSSQIKKDILNQTY